MKNKNVDILIVGAGASGAAAAWNLSSKNYKIVCLEQGPWLKKNSYSFDRPDWEKINHEAGITLFSKQISGHNINAIKITKKIT